MVKDAGGGAGGDATDAVNGPVVSVEINGMLDFYLEMQRIIADATEVQTALAEVTPLIHSGLNAVSHLGDVFPEGAQLAAIMVDRQHQFTKLMADVSNGILSIASASAVIAEMYGDGDFHSAVDLNQVAFAFGDREATAPKGFRDAQTWSEYRMQQQGGARPMALMFDRSYATHYSPAAGVDVYAFSDGSSIQVVTTVGPEGQRITETTVFGVPSTTGGSYARPVIETTTVQTTRRPDGSEVQTTSVVTGTERDGTTSTTVRETAADGTITVTNSTSTVVDGGEPIVTTSDPVVVPANQHPVPQPERGPMQEAQEVLDSHGSEYYIEQFGYRP
jgi:hypothetical protein